MIVIDDSVLSGEVDGIMDIEAMSINRASDLLNRSLPSNSTDEAMTSSSDAMSSSGDAMTSSSDVMTSSDDTLRGSEFSENPLSPNAKHPPPALENGSPPRVSADTRAIMERSENSCHSATGIVLISQRLRCMVFMCTTIQRCTVVMCTTSMQLYLCLFSTVLLLTCDLT